MMSSRSFSLISFEESFGVGNWKFTLSVLEESFDDCRLCIPLIKNSKNRYLGMAI